MPYHPLTEEGGGVGPEDVVEKVVDVGFLLLRLSESRLFLRVILRE